MTSRPASCHAPLELLAQGFHAPGLAALVSRCLEDTSQLPTEAEALLAQTRVDLGEEEEGCCGPASRLLAELPDSAPTHALLSAAARRYLRATRYLLPWIHNFAWAVKHQARGNPVVLFLRDALAFWPSLVALHTPELHVACYSRRHRLAGVAPVIFRAGQEGAFQESPLDLNDALLIDVGLYGSLIAALLQDGWCASRPSFLFFGSRNPCLTGWVNVRLGARTNAQGEVDRPDVIRLVDTIESLFKPFRACVPSPSDPAGLHPSGALARVCSAVFARACYRFSSRHEGPVPFRSCLHALEQAKGTAGAWLLRRPVPKWAGAEAFLRGWTFGRLPPLGKRTADLV